MNKKGIYAQLREYIEQETINGEFDHLAITTLPPKPGEIKIKEDKKLPAIKNKFVIPEGDKATQLKAFHDHLNSCQLCQELAQTRNQIVFGSGNPDAEVMFVGEAPGKDEDIQGLPFVGRSGQLLMDIVEKGMKLKRDQVYIANILKCRPPKNRNPLAEEVCNCTEFLNKQLEIVKPKVIIGLGLFAAHFLTGKKDGIAKLRAQFHSYQGIAVMPTYHPSYLLRNYNRESRTMVWEDIQMVMQYLAQNP